MEIQPGRYKHFKGGLFRVIAVAMHSETLEPMVVYRHLYHHTGDATLHQLWVRPAPMFTEQVVRDGYSGPRFQFLNNEGPFICSDCREEL